MRINFNLVYLKRAEFHASPCSPVSAALAVSYLLSLGINLRDQQSVCRAMTLAGSARHIRLLNLAITIYFIN